MFFRNLGFNKWEWIVKVEIPWYTSIVTITGLG